MRDYKERLINLNSNIAIVMDQEKILYKKISSVNQVEYSYNV